MYAKSRLLWIALAASLIFPKIVREIPNPWDICSARYLWHLGFKALATTSAGFVTSFETCTDKVR